MIRNGSFLLESLALLAIFVIINQVQAAEAPSTGTILKQQEQLKQERSLPKRIPEPDTDAKPETPPEKAEPRGPRIIIKSIAFSGATSILPEGELQAQVAGAIGQEYGVDEIKQIAVRINTYLRSQGFLLAQAYLPEQDVSSGELKIAIFDGRLEVSEEGVLEIEVENLRLKSNRIQKIAARSLDSESTVKTHDLERVLLLMNDLPGISAKASLTPGSQPGTTRIVAKVKEGKPVSGVAWVDNYGNRYSGTTTANGQVNVNDPLKIGDRLTGNLSLSEDQYNVGMSYSLPLGYDGLRMSGSVNLLSYEIGKELSSAEAEGQAFTMDLGISYPIIRSRARNLYTSATYNNKKLEEQVTGFIVSDRKVNSLQLGLSGNHLDQWQGGGLSYGNVTLTLGDIDLSNVESDLQSDELTAKVDGNYTVLGYSVSRLQRLPGNFSFWGQFKGQFADGNLDSSEQFSLGGVTGVRAYPGGEGSGDEGWLLSGEVRYDPPVRFDYGNIQLSAFIDYGHIKLNKNPWPNSVTNTTGKNSYSLAGAGIGASLIKSGSYSAKLQLAIPIGNNDGRDTNGNDSDGRSPDARIWLAVSYQF